MNPFEKEKEFKCRDCSISFLENTTQFITLSVDMFSFRYYCFNCFEKLAGKEFLKELENDINLALDKLLKEVSTINQSLPHKPNTIVVNFPKPNKFRLFYNKIKLEFFKDPSVYIGTFLVVPLIIFLLFWINLK